MSLRSVSCFRILRSSATWALEARAAIAGLNGKIIHGQALSVIAAAELKTRVRTGTRPLGQAIASTGISANTLTLVGLALNVGAAVVVGAGWLTVGGIIFLIVLLLLILLPSGRTGTRFGPG